MLHILKELLLPTNYNNLKESSEDLRHENWNKNGNMKYKKNKMIYYQLLFI